MFIPPMNPAVGVCGACQHPLNEVNCPTHPSKSDFVYFDNSYYHRSCLQDLMAERARVIQEMAASLENPS